MHDPLGVHPIFVHDWSSGVKTSEQTRTIFLCLVTQTGSSRPEIARNFAWPRGSTGVQRYGGILRSAANNLGEIPQKIGSSKFLVLKSFWVERTFWDSSLLVSLVLWDTPVLFVPPLPSPNSHSHSLLEFSDSRPLHKKETTCFPKCLG